MANKKPAYKVAPRGTRAYVVLYYDFLGALGIYTFTAEKVTHRLNMMRLRSSTAYMR